MKLRNRIFFGCLCTIFNIGFVHSGMAQKNNKIRVSSLHQLQEYFRYKSDQPTIISGHRGGMMNGFPENCIESCEKTLSLMPSFFEIDPRLTKDSILVLMHDKTLDRTTNGRGAVSDYTYKQLQELKLKDREGNVTDYKIPTLIEMLEWGKNKTIFNLDNKEVPWSMYVNLLKRTNYPNVILSVRSLEEALFYFKQLDQVMFCVAIKSMEDYSAYKNSGIPWNRIMAYVGYSMDPDQKTVYDLLHKNGVSCMIAVGPTKDRAKTDAAKKIGYREELAKKPDIIETDYPSLFIGLPSKK